ncbi:hypothetical protein WMY93_004091 [Mugilogobius chulae]|uniref:Uncharacterized protein n=1 Tax=Mugilogobius chulae TaxID=88201 RepID=A0AAW0PTZ0_9GOBI
MPSSTSLLEADDAESEVPPPLVHAFAGMGLEESSRRTPEQPDESLSFNHHHHFSMLGTVLDLKPLPLHRSPSEEELNEAAEDEDSARAHRHHHHGLLDHTSSVVAAETVLLYTGGRRAGRRGDGQHRGFVRGSELRGRDVAPESPKKRKHDGVRGCAELRARSGDRREAGL